MRKQLATVGLAAGLVAGGAGVMAIAVPAISGAQESTTTIPSTEEGTDTTTKADRLAEALQPLIDDGTLTQEQADAVIARLQEAMPRGLGGRGGHGPGILHKGLDTAADALGITEEELRTALQDGQSIADVASERGVDVQGVIDALVADAQARLAEEVAEGDITQEQADERLSRLTEAVTAMVNGERPAMPEGPGGRFRGGPRGDDESGTDEDSTTDDTTPSSFQTSSLQGA
jgi:polyhydroxyalkanoate synthesis regulator phasin